MDHTARACRLLSDPSPANRERLSGMPCDVKRLMKLRLRAHGDDVIEVAHAVWQDSALDGAALRAAMPTPIDARIWLSTWPLRALALDVLSKRFGPVAGAPGEVLPPPTARVFRALAEVHRIDPMSSALVLEGLRGGVDVAAWRAALGASDAVVGGHVALALFRTFALLRAVLEGLAPARARMALIERWFTAGETSEVNALARTRERIGDASLTMPAFRELAQEGARAALAALEAEPSISVVFGAAARGALSRALGLPAGEEAGPFDEPLFALLSREVHQAGPRTPDAHLSPEALLHFASVKAGRPEPTDILAIEHLACCEDDRCGALIRTEVAGSVAASRLLSGPMASHSSWPAPTPMLGPSTPHMIRCRDVLWETFSAMAKEEGRPVDDLVDEAMDRYRQLRLSVRESTAGQPGAPPSTSREPSSELGFDDPLEVTPAEPASRRASRARGLAGETPAIPPVYAQDDEEETTHPRKR